MERERDLLYTKIPYTESYVLNRERKRKSERSTIQRQIKIRERYR